MTEKELFFNFVSITINGKTEEEIEIKQEEFLKELEELLIKYSKTKWAYDFE